MNTFLFNPDFAVGSGPKKDILAAFRQQAPKNMTIQQGMTASEISEVVSEKVLELIRLQFEATKKAFEAGQKNQ